MSSPTSHSETAASNAAHRLPQGLLATLALFLLLEVALRLHHFGLDGVLRPLDFTATPILDTAFVTASADPQISWRLRPSFEGHFKGAPLSTNSHGFRDREITLEKPPGVSRLAVLGASMTMGSGVDDDAVYSRRLQSLLDAAAPNRFEVLNFAVGAYKIPQMLAAFEADGRRFSPDVVLLRLQRNTLHRQFADLPPDFESVRIQPTDVRKRLAAFFSYMAIRRLIRDASADRLANDWDTRARPETGSMSSVQTPLDRFAEARAAEGVRVVILLIPQLRELASRGPGVVAEKAP
ncbi:MAG: SGNH/GDSL hydrolase family protein, partial [Acidobacteriota bacterium]